MRQLAAPRLTSNGYNLFALVFVHKLVGCRVNKYGPIFQIKLGFTFHRHTKTHTNKQSQNQLTNDNSLYSPTMTRIYMYRHRDKQITICLYS